ncbi:MAG TPA: sirohydrochlorin cobaltochelatase [Selenomonadales bacterium]|nr:sirohydrochlorin cobaltochelatase [Selenomonadales bacterium]
MEKIAKRAFLMVGIGTAYQEARQLVATDSGDQLQSALPDYEVRRAFTSRALIEKLAENDGIQVDDERQALKRLQEEGFSEVVVQPFQVVAGEEYERVRNAVRGYVEQKGFSKTEILPCVTVWVKQPSPAVN